MDEGSQATRSRRVSFWILGGVAFIVRPVCIDATGAKHALIEYQESRAGN
jgi:hypothetical protein